MDASFKHIYPNLALIPDDILNGIDLEEEFNAYQLHRLYDILGLGIIKKTVDAQQAKYPDSLLYVATLRKRYKHRLPRDFYSAIPKPWCLYLFVTDDHKKAKIGISTNIQKRAFTLSKGNPAQTVPAPVRFDMAASLVISGFEYKSDAQYAETALKKQTLADVCAPPEWTPYYNARTEWRTYSDDLKATFSAIVDADEFLTLQSGIDHNGQIFTLLELLPLGEKANAQ